MKVKVGQKTSYERTFTLDDVRAFAEISGDKGIHHMQPDKQGRVMVQGLLTATLPTKLGGDLNYIAGKMQFHFTRPVFVGDNIRSEAVVTKATLGDGRLNVTIEISCHNQDGKEVLRGTTQGVIRD